MKILMMVDRKYPSDHAFLEEVYTKIFPNRGHEVIWIMRPEENIKRLTEKMWNSTKVYLISNQIFWPLLNFRKIEDIASKCDIIQVRNDISMGLIAIILSRRLKKPFVFQYSHLKADTLILEAEEKGIKYFSLTFYKGLIGKFLVRFILRNAELIFPISDAMKDYLEEEGFNSEKMVPMPLGADVSIVLEKINSDEIRSRFNLKNHKVLCYIGTMNRFRKLDFLIEIVEKLKDEYPIKLLMVGDGRRRNDLIYLKKLVKEKDLEDYIIFTGKVPRSQVPKYILASDVCLSPLPPNKVLQTNSPIKLMEYMNLGKPVVCNDENVEQRCIITKSQGGICVEYDVEKFVNAIKYLIENPSIAREMGIKGKKYIRKKRNYGTLAKKIDDAFSNIFAMKNID